MWKVPNRKCIRRLGWRSLKAAKTRNLIAVLAVALTTLIFTSLFTIALSLLDSYQEYTFRQIGGYSHGTFKEVDGAPAAALSAHKNVKEYGLRTVCGFSRSGPFSKSPAELSWMDENTAKWCYAVPTTGRLPETGMEIAMDTGALALLGVRPELGAQVTLTWQMGRGEQDDPERTDTFILVGFWEHDPLLPVHYLNVTEDYIAQVQADYLAAGGGAFHTDMNVMLASSLNTQGVMERIETDLGYQWEDRGLGNCVRIGVNWGYTAAELGSVDAGSIAAIALFLLLVMATGYLIIYNIFQISVSSDIRHYGLLKTIGATPGQLRRIVRQQALMLSAMGIPLGCLLGYGVGAALLPVVLSTSNLEIPAKISASPLIFLGAAAFALVTVSISCARPARSAGKIAPVEAVRYTDMPAKKKTRATRGAGVRQMALANLGRNRKKTVLVLLSLALAVVLLNCAVLFVNGFDMEKYLAEFSAADFIVGTTDYFNYHGCRGDTGLTADQLRDFRSGIPGAKGGCVHVLDGAAPILWMDEDTYRSINFLTGTMLEQQMALADHRGDQIGGAFMALGYDEALLAKLQIYSGDLSPLTDPDAHAVAMGAELLDDGALHSTFALGETVTVTYIDEGAYFDIRTGLPVDENTPDEFLVYRAVKSHDVDYTVCALVGIPYGLSYRSVRSDGVSAVLTSAALERDSGGTCHPMLYAADAPDEASEAAGEAFLSAYTEESDALKYESKALLREDFDGYRQMFTLVGGVLCFIVALVGVLNFFNAILTGVLARRREFAMLQSVGMTGRQLKTMLALEGLSYCLGAGALSLLLSLALSPLAAALLGKLFWFYTFRFTIWPVLAAVPLFALIGAGVPLTVYRAAAKETVVERLRAVE